MVGFKELITRQFRIELAERDKDLFLSFSKLKYYYDYPQICDIVDSLGEKSANYLEYIYGSALPKELSQLGKTKLLPLEKTDFKSEINWTILSIRKFHIEIQLFIDLQNNYKNFILKGDYKNAQVVLDEIEQKVCISLWSIEQRFLIIENTKGLKENTEYLNEINKENQKWFTKYCSHFYSLKAEKELSINQYNLALARLLFNYQNNDQSERYKFFNFKLNFLEEKLPSYKPLFLGLESYNSIVDRYTTLIRILQIEMINSESEHIEFIDSRLNYLSKKIDDPTIEKLKLVINTNFDSQTKLLESDVVAIKALDYYTIGNYSKARIMLEKIITENPDFIELYEIYIKSLINLNEEFHYLGPNESFQNRILSSLYTIIDKRKDISSGLDEIRKIAYNLSSFSTVSYYLMEYFRIEIGANDDANLLSVYNSNFSNPRFLNLLNRKIKQIIKERNHLNSETLNYLENLENPNLKLIKSSNLSKYRKDLLSALYHQKNEDYDKAILEWEDMLLVGENKNYQKERIIENLFFCKERNGELNDCIEIYVKNYFQNIFLVNKIPVESLKKTIKKGKYKNVEHNILLPIFFRITESDDYQIHTAYECFLINYNCYTPSELTRKTDLFNDDYIVFLLNSICTLDIFKHSPFITSSKQKLEERINVCKTLTELDVENSKEYRNEIERLTKKLIIQKGIQEIDESKIYVNQNGIIDTELKNLSSTFDRFKGIGELKSEKDISILSLYSDKVFSFKYSKDDESSDAFSKDPQFDIFKDIFYYLRDKFLFSNYGLQQYLSARIRHGVLLGEIRPEFEMLRLITEKEKGGEKYKDNLYWNLFFGNLHLTKLDKIRSAFAKFSSNVDTLINEEILSKYLQIRTEDQNSKGWLDYEFDDFTLQIEYLKSRDIVDLEKFLEYIFQALWKRTEIILAQTRKKINGEINSKFLTIILELEKELQDILFELPEELYNNITESRVNIENKLNKIANWFSLTESNISNFKIDKIIDVSLEYTLQTSLNKKVSHEIINKSLSEFKGEYYPSFVDLFRIFLDNAVKYGGNKNNEVAIEIEIVEDETLSIQFKNSLDPSIDLKILKDKIESFKFDLDKSMNEVQSGLHKAMRIIKSDLNCNRNKMQLFISDEDKFCVSIEISKNNILI